MSVLNQPIAEAIGDGDSGLDGRRRNGAFRVVRFARRPLVALSLAAATALTLPIAATIVVPVPAGAAGGCQTKLTLIKGNPVEVKSWGHKVAVKGVGDKAYRAKGDFQIDSIEGSEFCSVSVASDDSVTGVAALETNGTSDIPESANAIIASALGTICNRIYGTGNTKPSLQGLSALTPTTTAGS